MELKLIGNPSIILLKERFNPKIGFVPENSITFVTVVNKGLGDNWKSNALLNVVIPMFKRKLILTEPLPGPNRLLISE